MTRRVRVAVDLMVEVDDERALAVEANEKSASPDDSSEVAPWSFEHDLRLVVTEAIHDGLAQANTVRYLRSSAEVRAARGGAFPSVFIPPIPDTA